MNGMGGYVGSAEDKRRILKQQKEREEQRRQFEEARRNAEASGPALRQFGAGTSEVLEHAFKSETVGLVTRDEFLEKRQTLAERLEAETTRQREAQAEAAWQQRENNKASKRAKLDTKNKLSFEEEVEVEDDDGEEDREDTDNGGRSTLDSKACIVQQKKKKFSTLGKDPTVKSDFLPDRDRAIQEEVLREELKREWAKKQEEIKAEPLNITYSYWNGSGHRRSITVKKGDTVGTFLKLVQEQLAPQFREIRSSTVSGLMYVKEDLILPHVVTFYDLITKKVQGKSGPLFQFDLQEHAVTTFDPRLKSQDSHAGKVVERHWYQRNKHIFPYSRWTVYDPDET